MGRCKTNEGAPRPGVDHQRRDFWDESFGTCQCPHTSWYCLREARGCSPDEDTLGACPGNQGGAVGVRPLRNHSWGTHLQLNAKADFTLKVNSLAYPFFHKSFPTTHTKITAVEKKNLRKASQRPAKMCQILWDKDGHVGC